MRYRYSARDAQGGKVVGIADGVNPRAVAEILRTSGLVPVGISPERKMISAGAWQKWTGRVSVADLATFTRQLATMITAGLPLTDSLNLLRAQSPPKLSVVVDGVMADVQGGSALSSALARHPTVFSKVYVALVRAGESAGVMEKILNRLADTAEKNREFRGKVIGAMIYPIIVLVGMAGVIAVMVVVVIPKLKELYSDFGADLPLATKILLSISDISVKYGVFIVLGFVGVGFVVRAYLRTRAGRHQWDGIFYKLPVMGPLARQVMLTEVTRTLALLVGAGVAIVDGLNIVAESAGNVLVEEDLRRIAKQVEKGFPMSIAFTESPIFPPLVGQMVAVGEETGKLDDVLEKMSAYFEVESNERIKGLTTAIEPIILIVLAVGVGFLMYAVVFPIYNITNQI